MNICYIGDAASIHTQRWVGWFARDHDVTLISTTVAGPPMGYEVVTLPVARVRGARLLLQARTVRHVLAARGADVLHSHYINEAGWLGAAAAWRPLVVTAWGSDVYRAPAESLLARRLNPWAVRRADWVTCDSADQATVLRAWRAAGDRVSVIGWGVDRTEFHPGADGRALRERLGIPAHAPVLLSPRQWHPNSNVASIVAAHARLPPATHLILKRGASSSDDTVGPAIAGSPARERIRVVGRLADAELPSLYAAADVVVSLCTTDGTPASVLEAMALGRPVVGLANASLAEWVQEPGGTLVPGLDPAGIAAAVDRFLADPDARRRARERNLAVVARRADRDVELGRMAEVYDRLRRAEPRPA